MASRFLCPCGMAFTAKKVLPGKPVVCPACGAVQEVRPTGPARQTTEDVPADPGSFAALVHDLARGERELPPRPRASPETAPTDRGQDRADQQTPDSSPRPHPEGSSAGGPENEVRPQRRDLKGSDPILPPPGLTERTQAEAQPRPVDEAGEGDRLTVRCRDCGALNSTDDAVCGMCGARLGSALLDLTGEVPRAGALAAASMSAADLGLDTLDAPLAEKRKRKPIRYEGAYRVPIVRLALRVLFRPRTEMETLVQFLSYRDMAWKLLGLFLLGVAGLWLSGWRYPGLPIVSGSFAGQMPRDAEWYMWLGMAFSAAALITAGLTILGALGGMVTGHGWHVAPLAMAFLFVVALVNTLHLLLLPVGLVLGESAVFVCGWVLVAWQVILAAIVLQKILDADPILSFIMAVLICAATVMFYSRVYQLAHLVPTPGGPGVVTGAETPSDPFPLFTPGSG
jgi:hypothetical protein